MGTFDDMGDLAPKQSRQFTVKVPHAQLGISGAEGVYPVGVQILGTDTGGERSTDAIARATTFLPLVSSGHQQVPASVVWPFLMPVRRGYGGDYANPEGLLAAVSTGGRLRNLLDLAANTNANTATALIDPALLVAVDNLANGRRVADDVDLTDEQKTEATRFLDDLLTFARRQGSWILGFDRPTCWRCRRAVTSKECWRRRSTGPPTRRSRSSSCSVAGPRGPVPRASRPGCCATCVVPATAR